MRSGFASGCLGFTSGRDRRCGRHGSRRQWSRRGEREDNGDWGAVMGPPARRRHRRASWVFGKVWEGAEWEGDGGGLGSKRRLRRRQRPTWSIQGRMSF